MSASGSGAGRLLDPPRAALAAALAAARRQALGAHPGDRHVRPEARASRACRSARAASASESSACSADGALARRRRSRTAAAGPSASATARGSKRSSTGRGSTASTQLGDRGRSPSRGGSRESRGSRAATRRASAAAPDRRAPAAASRAIAVADPVGQVEGDEQPRPGALQALLGHAGTLRDPCARDARGLVRTSNATVPIHRHGRRNFSLRRDTPQLMSRANVDLVRRLYEAGLIDQDPAEWLPELAAPDIEYVNPPDAVEPGIRRGPENVVAAMRGFSEVWRDSRHELHELFDGGDVVVAAVSWYTLSRGSETEISPRGGAHLDHPGRAHRTVRVGAELEQRASSRRSGSVARLNALTRPAEDLDAHTVGIEDEERVITVYVSVLLGWKVDPRAVRQAP